MISNQYLFLEALNPLPRMVKIGIDNLGVKEVSGTGNSATILSWAKELNMQSTYSQDSIPWCGLFIAMVVNRSGRTPVVNPLWARNWEKWGVKAKEAMLGDILVFVRPGGGHVGIYIAEDDNCYHVLGGNQSDAVTIARIKKSRCTAIRRPAYNNQPNTVRKFVVAANGTISTNEA